MLYVYQILLFYLLVQIIGWREKSLRMLMHISDNLIHVAGDGSVCKINIHGCVFTCYFVQLANVVHPAVLECNLQQNGSYHYYNGTHVYVCLHISFMCV